jgi:hypothetical protein
MTQQWDQQCFCTGADRPWHADPHELVNNKWGIEYLAHVNAKIDVLDHDLLVNFSP